MTVEDTAVATGLRTPHRLQTKASIEDGGCRVPPEISWTRETQRTHNPRL